MKMAEALFCKMSSFSLVLVLLACATLSASHSFQWKSYKNHHEKDVDPDAYRNVSQLITSKGYVVEEHEVVTEDDFILGVQRIPYGRNGAGKGNDNRPVILLVHGLLMCSSVWVENSANQSLGFILADAGLDVWLGNMRGNTYSKKHKTLTPKDNKFWDWSWDEMAKYDLPALVNYVLKATNQSQIYYAGHSQGTVIGFAEFGRNPDLEKKIKTFFALAPVANVTYIKSPIRYLSPIAKDVQLILDLLGKDEFIPTDKVWEFFSKDFCDKSPLDYICENFLFVLGGFDATNMNKSRISVYAAENPSGTSVKNIVHYAQGVLDRKFEMFDYGSAKKNTEHYNQKTPPVYDVTKLEVPIALFAGTNDWLANPTDVSYLLPQLKNLVFKKTVDHWEHFDFIWALDAPKECYSEILTIIQKTEA